MNRKTYVVKIDEDGTRWYIRGWFGLLKLHRVEYANGDKIWYKNGKYHREDGPAVEWPDGDKYWFIEGMQYTEEGFNEEMKKIKTSCAGKVIEVDGIRYKLVK